eukprot:1160071-Pelagomonas_calceolata.AAC.4
MGRPKSRRDLTKAFVKRKKEKSKEGDEQRARSIYKKQARGARGTRQVCNCERASWQPEKAQG